ncbi:hypothetical protein LPC08_14710 [Roseomonas sp. OT10]|uniref:hypothetical protein n=1 Tax=Roseomonas cutis TaxID=2897332 RepID=UPI001E523668|nr:hypothetical protein [Roseomonas sp. OT10]UFN47278.1 hypothetical protein LPC08_14710 [Roseomonas sp. OT10]
MALLLLAGLAPSALVPSARAQQVPDIVRRSTQETFADCRGAGGRPSAGREYQTVVDLNGDGIPDYILDLSGLNCAGAESFFCGSAGCPVSLFLSTPRGHVAEHLGHVQGWELDRAASPPVMKLMLHGGGCGRAGADGCERRIAWNGQRMAALGAPPPAGRRPSPAPREPAAAPGAGGWELRDIPGRTPAAMVQGPQGSAVTGLALTCNGEVPMAVFTLRARPPWDSVTVGFAGSAGRAEVPIRPQASDRTRGAHVWVADLRGSTLPRLLAAPGSGLRLTMNGGQQGTLGLRNAREAVRAALAPCLRL